MIQIAPEVRYDCPCPRCGGLLQHKSVAWQGLHVCAVSQCATCARDFLRDLPHGQGNVTPLVLDVESRQIHDPESSGVGTWYSDVLAEIAYTPDARPVGFTIERFKECRRVIVLNTVDFLYGHSVLELFNAERHLALDAEYGLIVLIQPFLRWLVPDGIAEIWTVDLPMSDARRFYSGLSDRINSECERFDEVHLAPADVQPVGFDIKRFTRVPGHDFKTREFRIAFIWREDAGRLWHARSRMWQAAAKARALALLRACQLVKVRSLFSRLLKLIPEATYTVAGLGRFGTFPNWIDDRRVQEYDPDSERRMCEVYSQSRLVIGVHGSNMILPSAQAGMAISLMPQKRWGCFAQDLIFNEGDDRMAAFQKRILPITTGLAELADICENMVRFRDGFSRRMVLPFRKPPVSQPQSGKLGQQC